MVYVLVPLCFLYVANMINIVPVIADALWGTHEEDDEFFRVPHLYRMAAQEEGDQLILTIGTMLLSAMLITVCIGHPYPWLFYPEIFGMMLEGIVLPLSIRAAIYIDLFAARFPRTEVIITGLSKLMAAAGLAIALLRL